MNAEMKNGINLLMILVLFISCVPVSYTHLTLPTIA